MKNATVLFSLLLLCASSFMARAQNFSITYQGRLSDEAVSANGLYDLQFTIYDSETEGRVVGRPFTHRETTVSNGLFTATLDFGEGIFAGADRWLEISVTKDRGEMTTLHPRQKFTAAPYAVYAANVSAAGIAGQIADSQLSANIPRLDSTSNHFTGTLIGNGAGVSNVPAASLTAVVSPVVAWGGFNASQADVPAGLTNVVAVSAGYYHSLALKGNGTVVAWGYRDDYDFGQTNVPSGLNNVVAVSAGTFHSLAVKSDGTVAAWGYGSDGQTNVPNGLNNVVAVAAGQRHSLALTSGGMVVAWGDNEFGQRNIPAGLNAVRVAAGAHHNLALRGDGTVVAWGYNGAGSANVPAGLNNVVAVAAGGYHSLALKGDGTVVAWGTIATVRRTCLRV
jgi:hypothetical protein